jgi:Fic family protein
MTTRDITSARITQINRVNDWTPERCRLRIDELERENDRLRTALIQYQKAAIPAEKTLHGRPVLSIMEAAKVAGVKYWTAYRYIQEKYWEAEQDTDRQWMVFDDQRLVKKPRKSRKK